MVCIPRCSPSSERRSPARITASPEGTTTSPSRVIEVTRMPLGSPASRRLLPAAGESAVIFTSKRPVPGAEGADALGAGDQLAAIGAYEVGNRQRADDPAVAVEHRNPRQRGCRQGFRCPAEPARPGHCRSTRICQITDPVIVPSLPVEVTSCHGALKTAGRVDDRCSGHSRRAPAPGGPHRRFVVPSARAAARPWPGLWGWRRGEAGQ